MITETCENGHSAIIFDFHMTYGCPLCGLEKGLEEKYEENMSTLQSENSDLEEKLSSLQSNFEILERRNASLGKQIEKMARWNEDLSRQLPEQDLVFLS